MYTEPTGYARPLIVAAVGVAACTNAVVATVVSSVAFGFVTAVVTVFIVPLRSPKNVVAVAAPVTVTPVLVVSNFLLPLSVSYTHLTLPTSDLV